MNVLLLVPAAAALLVLAAIYTDARTRRRLVPGILLVLLLWVFSMPLTGNLLIGSLESGVRDVDCKDVGSAVLLAGGVRGRAGGAGEHHRLTEASLRRTIEAASWLKGQPQLPVYVIGGSGHEVREAALIVSLLEALDVSNRLVPVASARDTRESARAMAAALGENAGTLAVISSGFHLPRAMREFGRAGLDTCPVATDLRRSRLGGVGAIAPSPYALSKSMLALHEYAGVIAFGLRRN